MLICVHRHTGRGCEAENPDDAETCWRCGMSLRYALRVLAPHTLVGGYRVRHIIGHGTSGAVYEAQVVRRAGVRVALKECTDAPNIARLQTEFVVLRRLLHDHLPRYYEFFEHGGKGYLVMEFVPGQSLADVLGKQQEPLVETQVLGYAVQLCDVLSYLHRQHPPIIHCDIKPANIRLTPEGLIKLVDFGLLKHGNADEHHAGSPSGSPSGGPYGGTLFYGSPEQLQAPGELGGHVVEARSDIYSLGATLYHLLTGQRPRSARERQKQASDPLPPPYTLNSRLSPHVSRALMTALSLQPERRHEDTATFKRSLFGITRVLPVAPMQPAAPRIADARLRHILRGHTDAISSVAWRPDGQMLASGGADATVRLWQAAEGDGELLQTLREHSGAISSLAWRPDGQVLASGSADATVRLWRVERGRVWLLYTLRSHSEDVTCLDWSPDGRLLASGGGRPAFAGDTLVRIWGEDARLLLALRGHGRRVNSLAWSPDGRLLASGSSDTHVRLWHMPDGNPSRVLLAHERPVTTIAWNPDGQTLVSGGGGMACLWHVVDGKRLLALQEQADETGTGGFAIGGLAWSPDGHTLAGGSGPMVRLWRADKQLYALPGHTGQVNTVAWSPDGRLLASGASDASLRLWKIVYG